LLTRGLLTQTPGPLPGVLLCAFKGFQLSLRFIRNQVDKEEALHSYMKGSTLKLIALILTIIASLVVIGDRSRALGDNSPGASTQTSAAQEKTVEQVEKNIKVLNGMPASQIIPVMNLFASSLGRRCNFCHVNNNGVWDYAADTKPEKGTAREMIKLVLNNNATLSRLNLDPISCYSCHRGRTSPQSIPTLPLPLPSPPPAGAAGAGPGAQPQASPAPRPVLPAADDIFNKYAQALGGQAAIDKLKSRVVKGTLTQANGNVLQFEAFQASPDKFYQVVTTPQGPFERGYNGTIGWERSARGVREMLPGEIAQLKATLGLFSSIKLKEQFTRTRVGKDKIDDRDVYVVTGVMANGDRQRLFFDAATGLLMRRITYMSTMVGIIPEQVDFEDYRDVEGIKFPFTVRTSTIEAGNPVSTRKFTEIRLTAPIDESKFNMPAPKPATP
jgi:Photosynthetic reaction centre cytochrome C subunit